MKRYRAQALLAAVLCVFFTVFCTQVQAESTLPEPTKGSMRITLQKEGTGLADVSFRLYRAGNVSVQGKTLHCTPTPEFRKCGMPFDDLRADGLANHLNAFAAYNNMPFYAREHSSGASVSFQTLPTGLYLAVPEGTCAAKAAPFVITIPSHDENGNWIYDLDVYPKLLPDCPQGSLTVEKQWCGSRSGRPDRVTVWLLKNGVKADTAVLCAQTHWKHTWENLQPDAAWTVAEANVPKGYTVQYATRPKTVTITNSRAGGCIPFIQTGQLKWPVPFLLAAGVLLLFAAAAKPKKRGSDAAKKEDPA